MDKLTPKMIQALIDLRLENAKDPKQLNPAVRAGLVKRGLLSRHTQSFKEGKDITYHSFTAKGEDVADQLIQDRDLGHLTEEVWDAALVEDLKRSGDEDVSDHVGTGDMEVGDWLEVRSNYSTTEWMNGKVYQIAQKDEGGYAVELGPDHYQWLPFRDVVAADAPLEPIPAEHPWHASFVEADEADFEEARGDFGYGTPDPETGEPIECNEGCGEDGKTCINCAEDMYEQGRRFARHGAGSDEDHPEFLRGYKEQQDEDEPVVLLTSQQVITNAARIANRRTTSMELHVVRQAKGDESRYLLIISKLSRYLPRRIIEILVERLVIPRCPVCSVKPGRQEFAIKSLDRGIRWVFDSYCSDACRGASGSRMGWIRKPAA